MSILRNVLSSRALFLRCCAIVLACAAGLAAILNIFDAWHLAKLPFEINYEEGNILNAAVRIVSGLTPYPDPHAFPNVLNPYGPVFYYLVAIIVRLTEVGLPLPRLILVIGSTLVAAVFIALIVRKNGPSRTLAAAAAFLFIASPLVYLWMPLLRVDLFGLALSLAGLYLLEREYFLWSVALFVLALFVKVSLLAAPVSCLVLLIVRRQWRQAAWFAGTGLAAVLCGFALAQSVSHGWFAFHTFKTHGDPFSWSLVAFHLTGIMGLDFPLALLSAYYVAMEIVKREASLPAFYVLFAGIATVTSGKLGSDSNHMLELHAALTLSGILGLASLAERITQRLVSISLVSLATVALVFISEKNPRTIDQRSMLRDCGKVYGFVQRTRGEVLADNVGMLVISGKPVFISNPFVYRYLAGRGWNDLELRKKVHAQAFSAIVLSSDPLDQPLENSHRWTAGVLSEMKQNYAPLGHFQCTEANTVLVPVGTGNKQ
jgi:hypothetical protein